MDNIVFYILLFLLIICISFIYKLYNSKKLILEICGDYIKKLGLSSNYLLLNTDQILCLPSDYKKQVENLLGELSGSSYCIADVTKNKDSKLLVLIEDKKIIGMLMYYPVQTISEIYNQVLEKHKITDNPVYISSVIIDKRYRGQGFGKKIFNILFKLYKNDTILEVKKINTNAINLYRKLNYKIIGQNKTEYLLRKFIKNE